jgi:cytosine/adenosine deaminase-related metal-dependent hydrolase
MPGLINAHCHLDYTHMAGKLPASDSKHFPDWIKSILALKAHWSYTEYAASWVAGAKQLLDSGCTSVFDIEAVPELLPEAWHSTPLRIISLLEMTGVRSAQHPERVLADADAQRARIGSDALHQTGFSPHALYSTPPELLRLAAARSDVPISIHLAESEAEWEMYMHARGPLYDWLKNQRPMDDCGGRSPIQQAHRLGLLQPNLLAIHCNYLAPGDAELLANNKVTVVHCPRSHAYFGHAPFPYEELVQAGVKICIASDSLASIKTEKSVAPILNLWTELQHFLKTHRADPEEMLKAVTITPSSISPNASADLIAISYREALKDTAESLVSTRPQIQHRWVAGAAV